MARDGRRLTLPHPTAAAAAALSRESSSSAGAGRGLKPRELSLQRSAPAMMQTVDRAFAAPHAIRNLAGCQADHVAEHHNLTLLVRQGRQRRPDSFGVFEFACVRRVGVKDLFGW